MIVKLIFDMVINAAKGTLKISRIHEHKKYSFIDKLEVAVDFMAAIIAGILVMAVYYKWNILI